MLLINVRAKSKNSEVLTVKRSLIVYTNGIITAILSDIAFAGTCLGIVYVAKNYIGLGGTASAILGGIVGLAVLARVLNVGARMQVYLNPYDPNELKQLVNLWMDELEEDISSIS